MPLRGENPQYPAYTQLRQIPGGAHGLVHLARHSGYDLPCVMKTYDRPGRDDAVAFAEPRLLRELDHPHIVKIIDAQPDGDRRDAVTMVMPAYAGGDLRDRITRGTRNSVGQVVEWVGQIGSALDYLATTKGFLHRDVKPGNVVLDAQGQALLCDFGSAAKMSSSGHTAAVRATVPYQPPEVAKYGWMVARSDVYCLGLTAIELLDGRFLYEGVELSVVQSRVDAGRRAYPEAALASRSRAPHVPAALRTLLTKCVAPEPDDRPTAAALVTALERLAVVDWKHVDGADLDGEWVGSWPARARADRTLSLRVTSVIPGRGARSGKRVLEASYRKPTSTGWRTLGSDISPTVVDVQDAAAVARFFRMVSDKVSQRFPT